MRVGSTQSRGRSLVGLIRKAARYLSAPPGGCRAAQLRFRTQTALTNIQRPRRRPVPEFSPMSILTHRPALAGARHAGDPVVQACTFPRRPV